MSGSKQAVPGADWLRQKGPDYQLVLSSRARLSRNLEGLPFPAAADEDDLESARGLVLEAVSRRVATDRDWDIKFGEEVTRDELELMAEEHITSPSFGDRLDGRAVATRWRESRSVIVNEDDHVRIQATLPGARFMKAWQIADKIDSQLESEVQYCFDQRLGYLTSCPTNVGTGLSVSAMLHMPALVITGEIARTMAALGQAGLYVGGMYGEESGVVGNIFRISNRATLGLAEENIVSMVEIVSNQLVDNERTARKMLLRDTPLELADRVFRSLGIVERAQRMCFYEALELVSMVKLGVEMGLVPITDFSIMEIIVGICPFHVNGILGGDADEDDVDRERAPHLRRLLNL